MIQYVDSDMSLKYNSSIKADYKITSAVALLKEYFNILKELKKSVQGGDKRSWGRKLENRGWPLMIKNWFLFRMILCKK